MSETPISLVEQDDNVVIVRTLVDSFDDDRVRLFHSEVRAAAEARGGRPFVLDLASINFLPSMSLAGLVRLATEFRSRKQRLVVAGLQPQVREVFVVTRLDRVFELQDDVAAALRTIRPA